MTKFNTRTTVEPQQNLAGGSAYRQGAREELISILLASFVNDKFYRSAGAELQRVRDLVAVDPQFSAKAAVFARNEFGMRSISHVVAGEVARSVKGAQWTKYFFNAVVRRPDDMTEILAYLAGTGGLHPVPNALKKGFALAFTKFDGYQLAKYRGDQNDISLVDVVNLVKPRPTERNAEALGQLVAGTLRQTETWEAQKSAGQEAWGELLTENRLGYMALLKNLRNIMQETDAPIFSLALGQLQDPARIYKSLVLPFRFATAYAEIEKVPGPRQSLVLGALSAAATIAVNNVPELRGRTLVAVDSSGSMTSGRVSRSDLRVADIASLFGAALARKGMEVVLFDTSRYFVTVDPTNSVLTNAKQIRNSMQGGGTNFDLIFETNEVYDRVIILSDMQAWTNSGEFGVQGYNYVTRRQRHLPGQSALTDYRARTGANPTVIGIDLCGYGSLQFPADKCFQLAGWSEKIFDLLPLLEEDRQALTRTIDKVVLA